MSNKKESIKKYLGIYEFPSSSDEEENDLQAAGNVFRRLNNEADHTDYTNGEPSIPDPPIWPARRPPTRLERDQFWSMLNNPSRIPTCGAPQRSVLDSPPEEVQERCIRPFPAVDMKRILSFRKLNRGLNAYRHDNAKFPTTPMDLTANISRIKRADPARMSLPVYSRASIIPAVLDSGSSTEEPQPSTSRTRDPTPPPTSHLPANNNAPQLTVDLNHSDTDNDNQPQRPRSSSAPRDVPDAGAENANIDTLAGFLENLTEEIEPEAETAAEEISANVNEAQTNDTVEGSDTAAPSTSKSQLKPRTVKRKRESQDSNCEPCTVKEFNQCLLRLLECPVCLEWMEPPMSQCRRGHLVCGRCRSRLSACPVCRTAFSSVRNRAMEGVAEMLRYPCRHGCGREVRLRRRGAHEASCSARRYRCPAPLCADRPPLPLHDLHHHLQSKHPAMVKTGKKHKFSMKMNSEQHDTWLVLAARELFHLRVDVDIRTWGVVVYVAYIGPKCNANNFTYEVTVVGQQNERKLVYSRVTHSDLESSSLNVSRQDCFHLTLDQALNFLRLRNKHCEPDKFLDFYVEINSRDTGETPKEESDT
ncbi:unnamed protein product [Parnassius apollo]|uniref:E3 ubiquitin-protein ligase n=1 Tax=Parnassius apollo TaxID=110799 RepID=A0A8S3XP08_PARAO|nr:unnamed protein product [Parnassius apollo]